MILVIFWYSKDCNVFSQYSNNIKGCVRVSRWKSITVCNYISLSMSTGVYISQVSLSICTSPFLYVINGLVLLLVVPRGHNVYLCVCACTFSVHLGGIILWWGPSSCPETSSSKVIYYPNSLAATAVFGLYHRTWIDRRTIPIQVYILEK